MRKKLTDTQKFLIRMENKLNCNNLKMQDVVKATGIPASTISMCRTGKNKTMRADTRAVIENCVIGLIG